MSGRRARVTRLNPRPTTGDIAPPVGKGNAFGAMGDSITQMDAGNNDNVHGNSWATWMTLASGGRVRYVHNGGKGGDRSFAMLARLQGDLLDYRPDVVGIQTGTNDLDWTGETIPGLEAMIRRCQAAGIAVGLIIPPPRGCPPQFPVGAPTASVSTASGSLAAGSYDYVITTAVAASSGSQTVPSAPVTATLSGTGTITLNWDRNNDLNSRYYVYRRVSGVGNYQLVGGLGSGFGNSGGNRADAYPYYVDTGAGTPGVNPPADSEGSGNSSSVALDSTNRLKITRVRQSVAGLAAKYGLPLVDQYALLVDSTTGRYRAGLCADGIHPTVITQRGMGQNVWSVFQSMFPPAQVPLAHDLLDLTTMLGSKQMLGGGGVNGSLLPVVAALPAANTAPTGWTGTGNAAYSSTIASGAADSIPGNVLTVTTNDFAGGARVTGTNVAGSTWTVGDRLRCAFRFKCSGLDVSGGYVQVYVNYTGATQSPLNLFRLNLLADWTTWTPLVFEEIIPAGTTAVGFTLAVFGRNVSASIAQVTMDNLTANATT